MEPEKSPLEKEKPSTNSGSMLVFGGVRPYKGVINHHHLGGGIGGVPSNSHDGNLEPDVMASQPTPPDHKTPRRN